jgi:hypothetical protein
VYLLRQNDFGQVASLVAVDQAQRALGSETAHSVASGRVREANAAGEPGNRKTELALAFEAAMPQETWISLAFVFTVRYRLTVVLKAAIGTAFAYVPVKSFGGGA